MREQNHLNKVPLVAVATAGALFIIGNLLARSVTSIDLGAGMMFLSLLIGLVVLFWAIRGFIKIRPFPSVTKANGETSTSGAAVVCPICKLEFLTQDEFDAHWHAIHVNPDSFYIPQ